MHHSLIALATHLNLQLLLRLEDYYRDVEFSESEVKQMQSEIQRAIVFAEGELSLVLQQLKALLTEAEIQGKMVSALAD